MPDKTRNMNFLTAQRRLLENLRAMVEQGNTTESGLAERLGYSQPQVHNVLKGERGLTPEFADAVLRAFDMQLEDLVPERRRPASADPRFREVHILKGHIAAGQPFPLEVIWSGSRVFTTDFLNRYQDPILVKVGKNETSMLPTIQPNDLLLLDQSPDRRRQPKMTRIYAVSLEEGGTVKRCEVVSRELVVMPENMQQRGFSPRTIPLADRDILEIIRGEVVWIGREL
jgi:transcriptional regulator with XRE-family HTH domain